MEADHRLGRGRRALFVGATLAVGAVLGAAALAGVEATEPSAVSTAGAGSTAKPSAATPNVASVSPSYDAAAIYAKDSPGVVDIRVTEGASSQSQGGLSPFLPGGSQKAQAGAGFVYDRQRHRHRVPRGQRRDEDHRPLQGRDDRRRRSWAPTRRATPQSFASPCPEDAPPLALGDSSTVAPGEGVLAIGSPFGYAESITAGIVSAVDRDIQAPNNFAIPNTIQTDAAINHGNSGGPLIDSSGKWSASTSRSHRRPGRRQQQRGRRLRRAVEHGEDRRRRHDRRTRRKTRVPRDLRRRRPHGRRRARGLDPCRQSCLEDRAPSRRRHRRRKRHEGRERESADRSRRGAPARGHASAHRRAQRVDPPGRRDARNSTGDRERLDAARREAGGSDRFHRLLVRRRRRDSTSTFCIARRYARGAEQTEPLPNRLRPSC